MNKLLLLILLIILIIGQIDPLLEYFKSKVTSKRKFEDNAFRHINHIFVAVIFLIWAIWLFLKFTEENQLWLNMSVLLLGMFFLILSFITFTLYFNYLLHQRVSHLIYNLKNETLEIEGNIIKKNSIKCVHWHKIKNKKLIMIWSSFEHVEIILHDGTTYVISSLLLNLKVLKKFFQDSLIDYYISGYPKIK